MSEKKFWNEFEKNMKMMGLPAPDSLFSTVGTALGTIGAMANAVKTFGTAATISEILLTFPSTLPAASSSAAAVAASEIIAVAGAVSAAFYLGACIGSLLMAANETYGDWVGSYIGSALRSIEGDIGGLDDFIHLTICTNPMASPIRCSIPLAKRL